MDKEHVREKMVDSTGEKPGLVDRIDPDSADPTTLPIVPLRHPGRWIAAIIVIAFMWALVRSLVLNPNLEIHTVGQYLFNPAVLKGVGMTLTLTMVSWVLGNAIAIVAAVMRLSRNPVLSTTAWAYAWFFRGTPTLVQIIFWGFLGSLYPMISLKLPFTSIYLVNQPTASIITATIAAIIALTLNEGAYNSEIVRGGILSVHEGQSEAAAALGLNGAQTMRTIILPQSMRAIIPPMGNQFIALLKMTSLVSVVGGRELLTAVQTIYAQNFKTMPLLVVAALWYLALVSIFSVVQYFIEKRFGRGVSKRVPLPWVNVLRQWIAVSTKHRLRKDEP